MIREIHVNEVTKAVEELFIQANYYIGEDIKNSICEAITIEKSPTAKALLEQIYENYLIAQNENIAICQDTGVAVLFISLGQDVHFVGGDFEEAIQLGVAQAYEKGFLRKSIVKEPIYERVNTKNNTPAVIHLNIVPGQNVHIQALAKGFGSENMSVISMLTPAHGEQGVLDTIVQAVKKAGPNPCPPIVVGVGVGGTFEKAAILAKKATARPVGLYNPNPLYEQLEKKALHQINQLGIGAGGIGGVTTGLSVNIEYAPTHIAGMPVAVNICCHAARHASTTL